LLWEREILVSVASLGEKTEWKKRGWEKVIKVLLLRLS
jgi:hypothetical protein